MLSCDYEIYFPIQVCCGYNFSIILAVNSKIFNLIYEKYTQHKLTDSLLKYLYNTFRSQQKVFFISNDFTLESTTESPYRSKANTFFAKKHTVTENIRKTTLSSVKHSPQNTNYGQKLQNNHSTMHLMTNHTQTNNL